MNLLKSVGAKSIEIDRILQSGGDDFPGNRMPRRPRRSLLPYIVLGIIIIVIGYVGAETWLNWTIFEYMYQTKAGLDWFGIVFYGGITFATGGILALFFTNPIPRRSDIFEAFNSLMGLQYRNPYLGQYSQPQTRRIRPMYIRPSRTLWAFWQALKWVVLFGIFSAANGFPGLGNLTIVLDMTSRGYGSWALVPRILTLPLSPASAGEIINLIPTMELQYYIFVYFSTVVMIVLALRFFMKFIRDVVIRAGDKWIRDIFVALTAVMFSIFIEIPYWPMDVRIPYEWGAITTVMVAFFALALFFHFKSGNEAIPLAQRKRAWVIVAAIIIIAVLLINIGAYSFYTLNLTNNYIAYQWDPLTSKQVAVTQWAAGIQNISYSGITNVPNGNMTKTLSLIRQWDANASLTESKNEIGVNWLQLTGSPQISFVNGQEYWVNPTTFNYPASNWQSTHLIYTYSSKIIVMNTHTGQFVPVDQAFNLTTQPLMYYGEGCSANCSPTSPTTDGFQNDVYVGLSSINEIGNLNYSGVADYNLCGAQRALWFLGQGQVGFAFSPPQDCINMLHNRDIFSRVQSILISGLQEDPAAYMVTDSGGPSGGNNLYFAVQVYIDYPLHSAFASGPNPGGSPGSYLRLFGVVLVNVENGELQGYYLGADDGFLTSFYHQYYPGWGPAPTWLKDQLRYPEALLGNQNIQGQLDEDFVWHVTQANTFRSGADFFTRPLNTEVLYVPFVIGNNISFAAVQLVQFSESQGQNLAGMYVIYGGSRLGQFNLYQTNFSASASVFLGPEAAENEFTSDPTTRTAMTLNDARIGNILLYPVNGHLYYFIPGYVYPSTSGAVVIKNPFIDVIDAENANSTVRFINATVLDQNYGFAGVILPSNSSASSRTTYIDNLFRGQGVNLMNVTNVNPSSVNVDQYMGSTGYTLDSQNATATAFVNSFIKELIVPNNVKHVFTWSSSPGLVNFGFFLNNSTITYIYYMSVDVGT